MNKKETRHQLIRSLISETTIHTQQELQDRLKKMESISHKQPYLVI